MGSLQDCAGVCGGPLGNYCAGLVFPGLDFLKTVFSFFLQDLLFGLYVPLHRKPPNRV